MNCFKSNPPQLLLEVPITPPPSPTSENNQVLGLDINIISTVIKTMINHSGAAISTGLGVGLTLIDKIPGLYKLIPGGFAVVSAIGLGIIRKNLNRKVNDTSIFIDPDLIKKDKSRFNRWTTGSAISAIALPILGTLAAGSSSTLGIVVCLVAAVADLPIIKVCYDNSRKRLSSIFNAVQEQDLLERGNVIR